MMQKIILKKIGEEKQDEERSETASGEHQEIFS